MSVKKIKDLCVITRKYTDRDGKEKSQYENVGHILQMDDGSEMQLLKRTFNPAGVPNPDNRDTVILYRFDVKDKSAAPGSAPSPAPAPSTNVPQMAGDPNEDILF